MSEDRPRWQVRLTAGARADLRNILRWTSDRFGRARSRRHSDTLTQAIRSLEAGPDAPGSRRRDELSRGLMTLHVARRGRAGRHLVVYRIGGTEDPSIIEVIRLLHDSMDLSRHVDPGEGP